MSISPAVVVDTLTLTFNTPAGFNLPAGFNSAAWTSGAAAMTPGTTTTATMTKG